MTIALLPHDPAWADRAEREGRALAAAIGDCVVEVHHVGSTAIPGIHAKPVIDLLPVVRSLDALDRCRAAIVAAGYEWRGEFGLPGRRYLVRDDASGTRLANLHCYLAGSPEIDRHLAFRDHLRADRQVARDYDALKLACAARHPDDLGGYCDCKDAWIKRVEIAALAARRRRAADQVEPEDRHRI